MWPCKSQGSNACRSRLKIWPDSSPASRAGFSLFTLSLAHVSALMSFHAEICGLFHHKQADVALAARSFQTSKADINFRRCRIHPLFTPPGYMGAQAAEHTSDLFHGTRRVSSGKGISEAAANILTLSKNFTTSCRISRFLTFSSPISFLTWMKPWQKGPPPFQIQQKNFLTVVVS